MPKAQTVELDVRPYLQKKLEPFEVIMKAVKGLNKEDTFILHATFKPTPLLNLMKMKGFVNKVEKRQADHWVVTFVHKSRASELEIQTSDFENERVETEAGRELPTDYSGKTYELDNRGLEPPQPMVRTLKKLSEVNVGDTVIIHNDRVPVFLIEELNNLEYPFQVEEQTDGTARVSIQKTK